MLLIRTMRMLITGRVAFALALWVVRHALCDRVQVADQVLIESLPSTAQAPEYDEAFDGDNMPPGTNTPRGAKMNPSSTSSGAALPLAPPAAVTPDSMHVPCSKAQQESYKKCTDAAGENKAAKCKCCKLSCIIPACGLLKSFGTCQGDEVANQPEARPVSDLQTFSPALKRSRPHGPGGLLPSIPMKYLPFVLVGAMLAVPILTVLVLKGCWMLVDNAFPPVQAATPSNYGQMKLHDDETLDDDLGTHGQSADTQFRSGDDLAGRTESAATQFR